MAFMAKAQDSRESSRRSQNTDARAELQAEMRIETQGMNDTSDLKPGFLQLLTKSGPINPLTPSRSSFMSNEFLHYRLQNLQWRTGLAQGARGEVTDVEKSHGGNCQSDADLPRTSSWPLLPRPMSQRKLWVLSPDLEQDLKTVYPRIWEELQSKLGVLLQLCLLVLVVCTYSACPLTVSWAKVVGSEGSVPIKGRPFKESSVIVISWAMIGAVGLVLSFFTGGVNSVRQCFDRRAILMFVPAGIGWALADVCEVLAVARIDPATYGVISQARLLSSATAGWMIRGVRQTTLQWGLLGVLSMVCMAYCLVPDESVPNKDRLFRWRLARGEMQVGWKWHSEDSNAQDQAAGGQEQVVGVILALSKVALSVISGVYGETCFKAIGANGAPPELHIQMTQISFSSMSAALIGYYALGWYQGDDVSEFFSGPDGTWDARTVVVAMMYCWREWICNLCVKRFDSLVKNICNAVSLVVTYALTVLASGEKPFSALKVMLLLAVVAEVVNYSSTRRTCSVVSAVKPNAEGQPVAKVAQIPVEAYSVGCSTDYHPGYKSDQQLKAR
eukprot:CAMPEP_0117568826 /NCGR_PEP_ID=MMETSP0784-20121206/58341_1 /TAXON_ID=39447 /ORGANISM="" /LENGTH=557 /DNA_ID=CAMNT_0005366777 /DNA_START=9 /DNA_END=1678 /DNA_ORIENTATION=+